MVNVHEFDSAGVEPEDTGFEVTKPFDPNKVRVRLWEPTIDLVMRRVKENAIELAPDFQRKAGIWKNVAQSQLIESLLIRIPLPAFFMDGNDEDRYVVIDGIQRLTALKRFMLDHELRLGGMEFLKDLEGKDFLGLPRNLQRRLEETQITIHVIEKGTPADAKLALFKRINTGGLPLSAQEIRHALNPDPARSFLKRLAETEQFKRATDDAMSPERMEDRECVLRFMAFVLTPPANYAAQEFDVFLNGAMSAINSLPLEDRQNLEKKFLRAMDAAWSLFGKKAFRKLVITEDGKERRWPVNKALFESWSINLDACTDEQLDRLVSKREQLIEAFKDLLATNQKFINALSLGTGDREKVRLRFRTVEELIRSFLA